MHRTDAFLDTPAGAREQRFDRGGGHADRGGDFLVGEPVEVPQDESLPLALGQVGDRLRQRLDLHAPARLLHRVAVCGGDGVLDQGSNRGCGQALCDPPAAFVARDRCEPGCGIQRFRASLQSAIGVEKRLLGGVFGVVRIAEERTAEPEHHP